MDDKTKGGSQIITHKQATPATTPKEAGVYAEEISNHIEKYIGKIGIVFHELVSLRIHLDINIVYPTKERNFFTLVSMGMSDKPMNTPPQAAEYALGELVMYMPATWEVEKVKDKDVPEELWWPIRVFKGMAQMPSEYNTWLAMGHTVPNGPKNEPFFANTKQCCAYLTPTYWEIPEFFKLPVKEGKTIRFYNLHYIYESEMNYKLEKGSEALDDLFLTDTFNPIYNPKRTPVV